MVRVTRGDDANPGVAARMNAVRSAMFRDLVAVLFISFQSRLGDVVLT